MVFRTALRTVLVVTLVAAPWACGSSGNSGSPGADGGVDGKGTSSSGSGNDASNGSDSASSSGTPNDSGSGGDSSGGGDGSGGGDSGNDGGPVSASQSVLQRGNDIFRRGTFTESGLTHAAVPKMAPDAAFNKAATFSAQGSTTGQGLPSVLYLQEGPTQAGCPTGAKGCTATTRTAGAGIFLAFPGLGSTPNAIAFDETTGLRTWSATVTNGASGGGDGIRGTPAIDPGARRVYIVTGNDPHVVHALSVDTGVEVTTGGWPVTLQASSVSFNGTQFNSKDQNQRGGLLLLNNTLYIPFGGEDGDGGNYLGWIVAIDTTKPTNMGAWATRSQQSGIWGSGGLASDGTYVFATTSNAGNVPARNASDSEQVVRVNGLATFSRDAKSVFVANEWQYWDQHDLDFGASTPAYTPLPAGSKWPSFLVAPAKPGVVYVLDGSDLSSGTYPKVGGQVAEVTVANTTKQSVYTSPTIYSSASGIHAAINAGVGPFSCPPGSPTANGMIMSLLLDPGQTPPAKVAWCAANNAGNGDNWYPPVSTTSDGVSADPIVWFLSGNQLTGVNGDTGAVLVQTTGTACSTVPSLSFPIAVHNRIVVASIGHLCSWSVNGQ
jgi:hypothetical protein